MSLKNITVNGVPLEMVIDEAIRDEYRAHHRAEVRNMTFVANYSKSSNSSKIRNHSGAKSGRGRVVYSVSAGGAA